MALEHKPQRRKSLTRRSRKAVLYGLGVFFLGQLLFALALETFWRSLRDPEYDRKLASLRSQLRRAGPDRPLVLLLGSSRVGFNVRPDQLPVWPVNAGPAPLVFNFGMCSADPVLLRIVFGRLLADGIRPQWALIEVSPMLYQEPDHGKPTFADLIEVRRLQWRDVRSIRRYSSHPVSLLAEWLGDRLIPGFAHRFLVLNRYMPDWLPPSLRGFDYPWHWLDPWGWVDLPLMETLGPEANWQKRVSDTRAHFPWCDHYRPQARSDRAMRDLLASAGRAGIAVALLRMPDYLEKWSPPAAKAEMRAYVEQLARQFAVPVVDMRDWVSDTGFWDGVHFVHEMASLFTQAFGRNVLPALLNGQPVHLRAEDERVLNRVVPLWQGGFSPLEKNALANWHWCSAEGQVALDNSLARIRRVKLTMIYRTATGEQAQLVVDSSLLPAPLRIKAPVARIEQVVSVPPGRHVMRFRCDGKPLAAWPDPRVLIFQLQDFCCEEVEQLSTDVAQAAIKPLDN
jgi:hypothetical protein